MILTILLLAIVATVLIIIEFFVPGGILGLMGGLCLLAIVVISYATYGFGWGSLALICVLIYIMILIAVFVKWFPSSPMARWAVLENAVGKSRDEAEDSERETLAGKSGVAATVLRPSGKATIAGQWLDVVAESGMIEKGARITVVRVDGNRVVVRKVTEDHEFAPPA
jgi:membrane-bound serine protease (ClpP class)